MAVSRVVMNCWGRLFRRRIEDAGLTVFLETCYVDDLRYVLSLLDIHIIWDDKLKCWRDSRVAKTTATVTQPLRSVFWDKSDKRWRSEQTLEVTNNTSIQVV